MRKIIFYLTFLFLCIGCNADNPVPMENNMFFVTDIKAINESRIGVRLSASKGVCSFWISSHPAFLNLGDTLMLVKFTR